METNTVVQELKDRIKELEDFKHNIEKKIYAGVAVFVVLTGIGVIGVTWINNLKDSLAIVSERTISLEKELENWEKLTEIHSEKLNKQKDSLIQKAMDEIDSAAEEKLIEIRKINTDQLLTVLKDGSQELTLSAVNIKNSDGYVVTSLRPDKGGDGGIRINNQAGKQKILLFLLNDRPTINFFDDSNNSLLSAGIYSNEDRSFLKLFSQNGEGTLVKISSDKKGGTISQYHSNGRQIIYIGPEGNTGNGIFNAIESNGGKTASHTP